MSYGRQMDKRISQHTEQKGGTFLFETEEVSEKSLEQKSRIVSKESMNCITYYGILDESYKSESAKNIKSLLLRCYISFNGLGRQEAVQVLQQNFPRKVEIMTGTDQVVETS